jgi:uncharacterized peroxidase-related enzyme
MSWIQTVPRERADARLRSLYTRVAGPDGRVDNILQVHGLRPHTLEGHMALYKAVLHHSANRLPKWLLEALGIHVSRLNECAYCIDHHIAGLRRLAGDELADQVLTALDEGDASGPIDGRALAAVRYATRLTREPAAITAGDIADLREHGFDDGEILEINQVVSYFAYANRTVQGLGVDTAGDVLGLSPGHADDPGDWRHD